MKIKVTYEEADLKQLIRLDLARQGIAATDADIVVAGGQADIAVEVTRDDAQLVVEPAAADHPPLLEQARRPESPPPHKAPTLSVVEGGDGPVDMTAILGESSRIARSGGGKFPAPERQLMPGESYDFPTDE